MRIPYKHIEIPYLHMILAYLHVKIPCKHIEIPYSQMIIAYLHVIIPYLMKDYLEIVLCRWLKPRRRQQFMGGGITYSGRRQQLTWAALPKVAKGCKL